MSAFATRRRQAARALRHLVATPGNAVITLGVLGMMALVVPRLWAWSVRDAVWSGTDRAACEVTGGACWIFIRARWNELLYGGYPSAELWRPNFCAALLAGLLAGAMIPQNPWRRGTAAMLALAYPVIALVLLRGELPGLPGVETRLWGGLMLNFVLTFIAVVISIPLGLALAEARLSRNPEIAWTATAFIEFWRAAPIVTILFFGVVILPLLMPPGLEFSKFACVATALTLFASAYIAEAIRGGLQAVPKAQVEAATALSLGPGRTRLLVVWPQALRVALPAIVNIAIDLFKDTSLVTIVGLFDLLGALQQALKDPRWLGLAADGYAFVAALFLALCAALSWLSRRLERELARERR
ncbi:amino acid ABC transporter permease [Alsobacter sp. SYSU BS001988]